MTTRLKGRLFITGMLRSGTTLVDKLLHNHPDVCVGTQPFPLLFFEAKQQFLNKRALRRPYPMDPLFLESAYTPEHFTDFLSSHVFSAAKTQEILNSMRDYSGQGMPTLFDNLRHDVSGPFGAIYDQLLTDLTTFFDQDAQLTGVKEVLCEEYIPYLLDRDHKIILVLRDPRDVIASLHRGPVFSGDRRPILYMLRQWRKSVAFSIRYAQAIQVVRYEDLVTSPWKTLDAITRFLSLPPYKRDAFAHGIHDQNGNPWHGNSSFRTFGFISADSVGTYRRVLTEEEIRYIESVCYPEMRYLNMIIDQPDLELIDRYQESELTHPRFEPDYTFRGREAEKQRLRQLKQGLAPEAQRRWFLFSDVYAALKSLTAEDLHHA